METMILGFVKFHRILVVLTKMMMMMMTICATHGTVVENVFDMMEPGQNITGTRLAELATKSNIQCSNR